MKDKENITKEEIKTIYDSSERIAREIRMISRAFKKISEAGLKEETIVVLLHDSTNMSKREIRSILLSIKNLEQTYLKPSKEVI
jgi:hypothetical protein